jgi:hypothetical protein
LALKFLHMVYFYPTDGGTAEDAEKIAAGCRNHLTKIPTVRRLEVGYPAGTPREVVDNSYALALLVEFDDAAGHDIYQDHPDHHAFADECRRYWSRVQIYDSLVSE